MSRPPLRVALLGAGTVGRAVTDGIVRHPERLATVDGPPLALVGVAVRDVQWAVGAGVPPDLVTDAPAHLVA